MTYMNKKRVHYDLKEWTVAKAEGILGLSSRYGGNMTKNELGHILLDFELRFLEVSHHECFNEPERHFFARLSLALGMMGMWLVDDPEKDKEGP